MAQYLNTWGETTDCIEYEWHSKPHLILLKYFAPRRDFFRFSSNNLSSFICVLWNEHTHIHRHTHALTNVKQHIQADEVNDRAAWENKKKIEERIRWRFDQMFFKQCAVKYFKLVLRMKDNQRLWATPKRKWKSYHPLVGQIYMKWTWKTAINSDKQRQTATNDEEEEEWWVKLFWQSISTQMTYSSIDSLPKVSYLCH